MHEVPPTAGLPLRVADLFARRAAPFEKSLASFLDVAAVQIECSGTASLIVTLSALKRGSDRRQVVVPAYTCPLVALAIHHCGLQSVLCDVRAAHFELDPVQLARVCNENTLAVIATHLGGRVADLAPVLGIAQQAGAYVVEDAAQSLGATLNNQAVGMIGDAGFYSLAVGKGLTLFEGGVLLAREENVRAQLRKTSDETIPARVVWEYRRSLELLAYAGLYRPALLRLAYGWPLRRALQKGRLIEAVGDDFALEIPLHRVGHWRRQVGAHALRRLPRFLETLRVQALRRIQRLEAIPGLTLLDDAANGRGVWPFLMVLMPSEAKRDTALRSLWPAGYGVSRLFIHALPDYPYLSGKFSQTDVPNARDFAARLLTISNSPWLGDAEFEHICETLAQCVAGVTPARRAVAG
jgi:perosamine synthetase